MSRANVWIQILSQIITCARILYLLMEAIFRRARRQETLRENARVLRANARVLEADQWEELPDLLRGLSEQQLNCIPIFIMRVPEITGGDGAISTSTQAKRSQGSAEGLAPLISCPSVGIASGGSCNTSTTSSCSICLEEFVDGDRLKALRCRHMFHSACIDRWLATKNSCAYCTNVALLVPGF